LLLLQLQALLQHGRPLPPQFQALLLSSRPLPRHLPPLQSGRQLLLHLLQPLLQALLQPLTGLNRCWCIHGAR
jgi:hypothetical protein